MRKITDREDAFVRETVKDVFSKNGIAQWHGKMLTPYLIDIQVPVSVGQGRAVKAFNELFHALGVLPKSKRLGMGDGGYYCGTFVNEDGETFSALFNVPSAKDFKQGDEEYWYTLKGFYEAVEAEAAEEEAGMLALVEGIKAGRLKSKSPDGYLVLKGEFYDAIEAGAKKVEYRDFTEYNLKRTIGIKTVRFSRGYVKNAPQMRWEAKKVDLLDGDGSECDPFNVPDGFWPTAIAIYLGKRIG